MILFILFNTTCDGQNIESLHAVKYTTINGLSSYNIRKILKDKNGYLWVGTQYGLSRFDGRQFINFSKSALVDYQLCGVDIRELIEDTAMRILWVLPGEYGFNGIDLRTSHVAKKEQINYGNVEEFGMAMALLNNRLWLGSSTGLRIFDIAGNRFGTAPYMPDNVKSNHDLEAKCLYVDNRGNLWCFYKGYGIVIYDGKMKQRIRQFPLSIFKGKPGAEGIVVNECVAMGAHEILAATSMGLKKISFNAAYDIVVDDMPCRPIATLNTEPVEALCKRAGGQYYAASHSQIFRMDSSLESAAVLKDSEPGMEGEWFSSVHSIYCDENENIWLGCQQGLAFISAKKKPVPLFLFR